MVIASLVQSGYFARTAGTCVAICAAMASTAPTRSSSQIPDAAASAADRTRTARLPLLGIDRHCQQIAGLLPHSRAKGVVKRAQINASVRSQKQAVVLAVRVAIPHQRVENELLCPLPNQRAAVRQPFQQGKRIGSGHGILRMPRNAQRLREILNMDAQNLPVGADLAIEPFDNVSLIFAERPHERPCDIQPACCRKMHGRILHQRGAAKALMGRLHDVGRRVLGVRPGPGRRTAPRRICPANPQGRNGCGDHRTATSSSRAPQPVNLDCDVLSPCELHEPGDATSLSSGIDVKEQPARRVRCHKKVERVGRCRAEPAAHRLAFELSLSGSRAVQEDAPGTSACQEPSSGNDELQWACRSSGAYSRSSHVIRTLKGASANQAILQWTTRTLPSFHAPLKLVVTRERKRLDAQRLAQHEKIGGRAFPFQDQILGGFLPKCRPPPQPRGKALTSPRTT